MHVVVVSTDDAVIRSCARVVTDIGELVLVPGSSEASAYNRADILVWDQCLRTPEPADVYTFGGELILLGEYTQRHAIRQYQEPPNVTVLLKPVDEAALEGHLKYAVTKVRSRQPPDELHVKGDNLVRILSRANLKLQEQECHRVSSLARTMHDFRVPLTALQGYCELLMGESIGRLDMNQLEVAQGMRRTIKRLSFLSSGLLETAVGGCVLPKALEGTLIEPCIAQAVQEIRYIAAEKDIDVRVRAEQADVRVRLHSARIEQILVNLLENACKFTPRHGHIELFGYPIRWEPALASQVPAAAMRDLADFTNAYRVDVQDTGPGFAADLAREGGWEGLGLSICRRILENKGGQMWITSNQKGAMVSFVLPCKAECPTLPEPHDSTDHRATGPQKAVSHGKYSSTQQYSRS